MAVGAQISELVPEAAEGGRIHHRDAEDAKREG
jgi:hypothetical protein